MSTVFTDGFDKYGPNWGSSPGGGTGNGISVPGGAATIAQRLTQGEWTLAHGGFNGDAGFVLVPGLSETGQALALVGALSTNALFLSKTLPAPQTRFIGGRRFSYPLLADGGIVFSDSNTPQCSIVIQKVTGFILFCQGQEGTVLQTSSVNISANTTHELEWDITINSNPALGGWTVWLDGVAILNGIGVTQQSGNASVNVFQEWPSFEGSTRTQTVIIDDYYWFNTSGSFNNAALLSNPRIETQFAVADHQKQFANNGNIIGVASPQNTQTTAPGANTLFLRPFTPNVNCTINDVLALPETTNLVAQSQAVIYGDSAGAPHTLLSAGTTVVGTTAGVTLQGALTTPQSLTAGTQYWIGFITDSSITLAQQDGTGSGAAATLKGYVANNTFGSGAPNPAPAMSANQPSWVLYGSCSGASTNWESVSVNPPPGELYLPLLSDVSSVKSANVGNEDLYTFPALSADVVAVYTVGVKGHARLAISGVRTFDLRTLSGATDSAGSNSGFSPITSCEWFTSFFDDDPNTVAAWLPAHVPFAYSGPKIAT